MTREEAKAKLRQFIVSELMDGVDYALVDDEPLVSGGLIDSFCLAHVAVFLEREFGVWIPEKELNAEHLDTIEQIVDRLELERRGG